jgi:hypothetical protein
VRPRFRRDADDKFPESRAHNSILYLSARTQTLRHSAAAQTGEGKSLDEANKELSNPISSIWALQPQENTNWLNKPEQNVINLQFQPVLALALTNNWNLITRPVFPVMNSSPYVNSSGNLHRVTGFGDTILATLISANPKLAGPWLLAAGPSFIFPTASNSCLGQNKWQIGPAGSSNLPGSEKHVIPISAHSVTLDGGI